MTCIFKTLKSTKDELTDVRLNHTVCRDEKTENYQFKY